MILKNSLKILVTSHFVEGAGTSLIHFHIYLEPSSIRLITDKVTKKPKGFAFVEFTGSKYLEVKTNLNDSE